MIACTNCSVDLSNIEIIERTAKSGKNMGSKYKARICSDCGTFNFVNEVGSNGLDNEVLAHLKRIEGKLDKILLIFKNDKITQTADGKMVIDPADIEWGE